MAILSVFFFSIFDHSVPPKALSFAFLLFLGAKFVEHVSAENLKRTFVSYGEARDWTDPAQGQGEEFLYQSVQCKNVWIPMGDIFAN